MLSRYMSNEFGLLGNFLASDGSRDGKVIKVVASGRTSERTYVNAMRMALAQHYGKEKTVALGGVFVIEKGHAKLHVMPDFSPTPLTCDADVDNWSVIIFTSIL